MLWDVVEDKVCAERARDIYGVALDMEHRAVDWDETRRMREKIIAGRREAS